MAPCFKLETLAQQRGITVGELLDETLKTAGSPTKAADALGVGRATIYRAFNRHTLKVTRKLAVRLERA